jgi:hypothetical protein
MPVRSVAAEHAIYRIVLTIRRQDVKNVVFRDVTPCGCSKNGRYVSEQRITSMIRAERISAQGTTLAVASIRSTLPRNTRATRRNILEDGIFRIVIRGREGPKGSHHFADSGLAVGGDVAGYGRP